MRVDGVGTGTMGGCDGGNIDIVTGAVGRRDSRRGGRRAMWVRQIAGDGMGMLQGGKAEMCCKNWFKMVHGRRTAGKVRSAKWDWRGECGALATFVRHV
jgi:hypothetical protein